MTGGSASIDAQLDLQVLRLAGRLREEQADADLPRLAVLARPVGDADDAVGRVLAERVLRARRAAAATGRPSRRARGRPGGTPRARPGSRASPRSAPRPASASAGPLAVPAPTVRPCRSGSAPVAVAATSTGSSARMISTDFSAMLSSASADDRRAESDGSRLRRNLGRSGCRRDRVDSSAPPRSTSRCRRRRGRTGAGTAAACREASARSGRSAAPARR